MIQLLKKTTSSLFFVSVTGTLIWILARLMFGTLGSNGIVDQKYLIFSLLGALLWEIGLSTMPKEATMNPQTARLSLICILSAIIAISYLFVAFVYPDWLRETTTMENRFRKDAR